MTSSSSSIDARVTQDDHSPFITAYKSIGGWKACAMWWNPDIGGFWEPENTGVGAYRTRREANAEARDWAEDEGVRFIEAIHGDDFPAGKEVKDK